jgi:hypothetical protein
MSSQKGQKAGHLNINWKSLCIWMFVIVIIASVWSISQALGAGRLQEKDSMIRQLESQIKDMQKEKEMTAQPSFGDYEWQWAGDNLVGTLSLKKNAEGKDIALVDARKIIRNFDIQKQPDGTYAEIDEGFKSQQAVVSTGDGTVSGNKSFLKLTLPVLRNIFDIQGNKVADVRQIIEADLAYVEAYAGKVTYVYPDKSVKKGDMILVRYNSGIRP